jgi:methylisocitrate lyase
LALIVDGGCGFGDPMHVQNTVRTVEAVGCAAIEIEDQVLPKRAHHHIGIEHLIGLDLMVAKIEAAVAARRDPDFLIIGRTNAARSQSLDEALRRGEALHRAGADILLIMPRTVEDLPSIATRMPRPLMHMLPAGGIGANPLAPAELLAMGFSLLVDSGSPLLAMHRTLRRAYAAIKAGRRDPTLGAQAAREEVLVHQAIGLEDMLAIERATVEPDPRQATWSAPASLSAD